MSVEPVSESNIDEDDLQLIDPHKSAEKDQTQEDASVEVIELLSDNLGSSGQRALTIRTINALHIVA